MKTNFYKYLLGVTVGLALIGCSNLVEEPSVKEVSGTDASLTIDMGLPVDVLATRSIANDPRNNQGTWSEWEKYIDGSLLYNVSLFVVDSQNKLVGYRQIAANSPDVDANNGFYDGNAVMCLQHQVKPLR